MEEEHRESQEGDLIELDGDDRKTLEIAKHALVGRIISEKALNRKTVSREEYDY